MKNFRSVSKISKNEC